MSDFFQRLYSWYVMAIFAIVFILLLPFFLISIIRPQWKRFGLKLHHVWSQLFYTLTLMPVRIEGKEHIGKGPYVLVSNHFSYMDIASLCLLPIDFAFVGKSSLSKVPLFGFVYRKLHLTVDRSSIKDSYKVLEKSRQTLRDGLSVAIYPEGGIMSRNPPEMARFKDGAFRLAIEQQIPIIPITIPYNWIILPDDGKMAFTWEIAEMIVHEPIPTVGMTHEDTKSLSERVYKLIDKELIERNDRQRKLKENSTSSTIEDSAGSGELVSQ